MVYSVINFEKDPCISLFMCLFLQLFIFSCHFLFINISINFCILLFINLFIDFLFTDISFIDICVCVYTYPFSYLSIYLFINVVIHSFIQVIHPCIHSTI